MVIRSYVRSTDCHCESRSQNIFSCIDIPVDACSHTARTIPTTNTQRQFIHYKTAMVTTLTTREKSVNFDQCSPVPFTFIFKLTKELTPSSVTDASSEFMVFDHISNCQVFNSYQTVFSNQASRQLMQKISTSIADSEAVSRVLATLCAYALHFGVYLGYFKSCFISIVRAFGFPTQQLLRDLKLLIQFIKMLWIGYFLPVAGTQQTRDANIYTNLFINWRQWSNSSVVYQQRNKPSTRRFKFDCDSRRTNTVRQKSRPNYIQCFFAFSKPKSVVFEFKRRASKFSRTTIAFSFKPWILGFFTPEVSKCFLQMSQTLHERIRVLVASRRWRVSAVRYTANFVKKVQVFGLFPTGQQARGLLIVNSLLPEIPAFGFSSQGFVIDQTYTTHCPSQEIFLLGSRVKAIAVCTFSHTSHYTTLNVKT